MNDTFLRDVRKPIIAEFNRLKKKYPTVSEKTLMEFAKTSFWADCMSETVSFKQAIGIRA